MSGVDTWLMCSGLRTMATIFHFHLHFHFHNIQRKLRVLHARPWSIGELQRKLRVSHARPWNVLQRRRSCNAVCVTTSLTSRRFSGAAFGDDDGVGDREQQRDPREVHERELTKAVVRALDGALGRPVEGEVYAAGWTAFTRFPSRA